jgi:23S rRNA (cytosine1962-C5)-methyltransferase
MKTLTLKSGKDRSVRKQHPWIFESSLLKGRADAGETVRIESDQGEFLAWAAFSPDSRIRARVWSFKADERIDAAFFERQIALAVNRRLSNPPPSTGMRLIHAEADGLPGLVVDRYNNTLCVQFGFAGVERWKKTIVAALVKTTGLTAIYERSDTTSRELEGLPMAKGWLHTPPTTPSEAASPRFLIQEHNWKLMVDLENGHKTGFYLDQRNNRKRFAEAVAQWQCQNALNLYCYSGGFSVAAFAGGARQVTSVDSSAPALEMAAQHIHLNGFNPQHHELLDADVPRLLRQYLAQGRCFDAIVLDPPKFAPTASHAEKAAFAYKDINLQALKLLRPGGLLFTFSCSGGISADLFHKIVAGAAMDAGVDGTICERLGAPTDHPCTLRFPEGEYLKGLMIQKH